MRRIAFLKSIAVGAAAWPMASLFGCDPARARAGEAPRPREHRSPRPHHRGMDATVENTLSTKKHTVMLSDVN
jgi:hypothetical protein